MNEENCSSTRLVYMTVGSREEALRLAGVVVKEKLAACANVIDGVTSIYEWQGKMQEEAEFVVILKTASERTAALQARLVELHSYDCPCVVSLPLTEGHDPFFRWVTEQTSS